MLPKTKIDDFMEEKTKKRTGRQMRFYAETTRVEMPFVQIGVDDERSIIMLIDTGSNVNVMFDYAYQELKQMMKEEEGKSTLVGIGGESAPMDFVSGDFSICGKTYNMLFVLQVDNEIGKRLSQEKGFPIAGIIGTSFMTEHGWIIDFGKQAIIIPNTDVSSEDLEKLGKSPANKDV